MTLEQATANELAPRDLLVHLRAWLMSHRETHTQHFGYSDDSGHPHGYSGVVIPEWDVRQRLDEIDAALAATKPCPNCQGTRTVTWRHDDGDELTGACPECTEER